MEGEFISKIVVASTIFILGLLEALGGLYFHGKRSRNDYKIEVISLLILPTIIQPLIFLFTIWLMEIIFPQLSGYFIEIAIGWHILAFVIFDDLTQYWWHRFSHVNPIMWKLHRPHHVIEEMGVMVTYRNAVFYYVLMPGIWLSSILVYLGMGYIYLFYITIKLVVILLAHSETKWDRMLYQYKILAPLAWIVERIISTPSTHFAHHGLSAEDNVSNPNGNFGNLLFIWDIIFGTAKITRKYPTKFGAWNQIKESWYIQLLFPLIRSKDPKSELHSIITKNDYDPNIDANRFKKDQNNSNM